MCAGSALQAGRPCGISEEAGKVYLLTSLQFSAVEQSYEGGSLVDALGGLLKGLWSTDDDKLLDLGKLGAVKDNIANLVGKKTGDLLLSLGTGLLKGGPTGLLSMILTPFAKPLINWIEEQGKKHSQFNNSFIGIPDEMMFRPPRLTARPRITGPHTAIVVGPNGIAAEDGADVHTDQFGRVKVWFPWDVGGEESMNTAWIRVAEGWAGGRYGLQFPPRVGQEVLVAFLDGDPDRPVITGRLYNPRSPQPFDAPGQSAGALISGPIRPEDAKPQTTQRRSGIKTASTPRPKGGPSRFHMLRFDDNWEKEQLLLRSQGRTDVTSMASYYETVHGDRHMAVGGVDPDTNKGGGSIFVSTGGEYDLSVHDAFYQSVGGVCEITVKGDVTFDYQASWSATAANQISLNAKTIVLEASQNITLKVGGNFVVIDASGVSVKGMLVNINSGGSPKGITGSGTTEVAGAGKADPGEPPNWLAIQPKGHGGRRKVHIVGEHHGLVMTRNDNGTVQAAPGVVINSTDPAFIAATANDLAKINDTEVGRAQLQAIATSGKTVTIENAPDSPTSCSVEHIGEDGKPADSTVKYGPAAYPIKGAPRDATSDPMLFHALQNAADNANGQTYVSEEDRANLYHAGDDMYDHERKSLPLGTT